MDTWQTKLLWTAIALLGAVAFGWFCVRLTGAHSAMLTLAFAQIAWSIAFQWTDVTGGDNGLVGVWPATWAAAPSRFFWLCFIICGLAAALLRAIQFSPFGYALRALRDNDARAAPNAYAAASSANSDCSYRHLLIGRSSAERNIPSSRNPGAPPKRRNWRLWTAMAARRT